MVNWLVNRGSAYKKCRAPVTVCICEPQCIRLNLLPSRGLDSVLVVFVVYRQYFVWRFLLRKGVKKFLVLNKGFTTIYMKCQFLHQLFYIDALSFGGGAGASTRPHTLPAYASG